ncbi:MAG: glycerophosphodiester phosphodiesterase family protein [Actinomycetaceae bacterium]
MAILLEQERDGADMRNRTADPVRATIREHAVAPESGTILTLDDGTGFAGHGETPLPTRHPAIAEPYGAHAGPWAIAHRGGPAGSAENTIGAFTRAVDAGLTYLETDVRVSADGVAVAFHDATLDRVTDLTGPVQSRTWATLSRTLVDGAEPVTRIEDLLAWFPDQRFIIDIKQAEAIRPLVAAIRRTGATSRVCVAGGWDAWLAAIREQTGVASALGWRALFTLYSSAVAGVRPPAQIAEGGRYAHAAWRLGRMRVMVRPRVAARLISMAHDLRLKAIAWTVDDPAHVGRLIDQGIDGVIGDDPAGLVSTFASRGFAPTGR